MKRAKKRCDPSDEPFASRLSDNERSRIATRLVTGIYDDSELEVYMLDIGRAPKKLDAAVRQLREPDNKDAMLFSRPDLSAASAMATVQANLNSSIELMRAGAVAKRSHKRAGMGRHSEFNDPETAERYQARRNAWRQVDAKWDAAGRPRRKGRALAAEIARITGEAVNTIRTWLRQENKAKKHRAAVRPFTILDDYSQLVD